MEVAIRAIHLFSAALWGGGVVMLAVFAAASARTLAPEDRGELFRVAGRWFLYLSGVVAVLLVGTGLELVQDRYGSWESLSDSANGGLVTAKISVFAGLVVLTLIHSLVLGPSLRERKGALARAEREGSGGLEKLRAEVRMTGMISGIVSLLLIAGTLAVFYLAADLIA